MKRQLMVVTEIRFVRSDRITRLEFWNDTDVTAEEWTREHPGAEWDLVKKTLRMHDLDRGLAAYRAFVFEFGMMQRDARLRGIAVCTGVQACQKHKVTALAYELLDLWYQLGRSQTSRYFPVFHHAFLGHFPHSLPRGVTGAGCWAVQFGGLKACRFCDFEDNTLCLGKNSVGVEIPILGYLTQR
jgi:hypothetical protein